MENTINARVLTPTEAGDRNGDYHYELNGEKSKNGYVSRKAALAALNRKIESLSK
jgi:hypothetical protein